MTRIHHSHLCQLERLLNKNSPCSSYCYTLFFFSLGNAISIQTFAVKGFSYNTYPFQVLDQLFSAFLTTMHTGRNLGATLTCRIKIISSACRQKGICVMVHATHFYCQTKTLNILFSTVQRATISEFPICLNPTDQSFCKLLFIPLSGAGKCSTSKLYQQIQCIVQQLSPYDAKYRDDSDNMYTL